MSVTDSTLAIVARKLHGLNPHKDLSDAVELEQLLIQWFETWMKSDSDYVPTLEEEEDTELHLWLRTYLKHRSKK